jgi:hypothetical protein
MALTTRGARLTSIAWLVVAALWPAQARAQLPLDPVGSPFEMVGFIQSATLNGPVGDVFAGGTITLNNNVVVVPRNTILQMPATALAWSELFKFAPPPYGPTETGMALADVPTPPTTYEVFVQGNRVGNTYIAGLIFISQLSLHTHQGFINYIDYSIGEIRVGGTPGVGTTGLRVRLNDPKGRFGRAMSNDVRFMIDEDNPTVRAETAYPMCLPRTNPFNLNGTVNPATDDPLCPQGNRPQVGGVFTMSYTMPRANNGALPDAMRMAPFEIGDYLTLNGNIVDDALGQYVSAWSIVGNVGIYTARGSRPSYVAIDVIIVGTGPTANVVLAQEGAKRTRIEGFTTDLGAAIRLSAVDVNPCDGSETDRFWALQAVDQGPAAGGAIAGRYRFRST